jgi:hypothetical protein
MSEQRAVARPPWNKRQLSYRLSMICYLVSGPCLSPWHRWFIYWLQWAHQTHKPHMQHKGTQEKQVDPSHWEDHTGLRSFFSSSYVGSNSKGALI